MELAPAYASGYAAAAMTVRLLVRHEEVPRAEGLTRVETLVERALALDPNLATAHAVLGALEGARDRMAEAEAAFRRALELHPGDATALDEYANFLIALRRLDEGEPLA